MSELIPIAAIAVGRRLRVQREEHIAELASDIQDVGLVQPIVVARDDGQYRLVAGLRTGSVRSSGWAGPKYRPKSSRSTPSTRSSRRSARTCDDAI